MKSIGKVEENKQENANGFNYKNVKVKKTLTELKKTLLEL